MKIISLQPKCSPDSPDNNQPRPASAETHLHVEHLQAERKFFAFAVKENARGRFLQIVEEVNRARRSQIIVPISGLGKMARILADLAAVHESPGNQLNPNQSP